MGRCGSADGYTHHYHTRRSRWVFRQVMGKQADRLSFIAAPTDDWTLDYWWHSKAGLNAVLTEYMKFMFYLFRYGDWRAWAALAAAGMLIGWRVWRRCVRAERFKDSAKGPESQATVT